MKVYSETIDSLGPSKLKEKLYGPCKFACFFFFLALYLIHQCLILLLIRNVESRLQLTRNNLKMYSKIALSILGIKVETSDYDPKDDGFLVVCNHLSYLDVLVIATKHPATFITSTDIEKTAGLGLICKLAACVFVERNKGRRTIKTFKKELSEIKQRLSLKLNIVLFPEGTSSNGEQILPFKSSFFQTAIDAQVKILPLHIKYTSINGNKLDNTTRDFIHWYGDMTFINHLFNLCLQSEIIVKLTSLKTITPENATRYELKDRSYEVISREHARY